ncbi:MAG: PBECR4 domain-containing protein [Oscillospiraceae bacterium]
MDKLQECAKSFEKLLDKKYHIIIGRKGKSTDFTVEFSPLDFHHLMGLGKLKDLRIATQNRGEVFSRILNGTISDNTISQSRYVSQIQNRFSPLVAIEQIFDDNKLIFRYNEKQNQFSLIQANYLLSTPHGDNDIYIFLDRKGKEEEFFCRSFFPKENRDYTIGQTAYTLLFKEKITISSGEKELQYDRLSPR